VNEVYPLSIHDFVSTHPLFHVPSQISNDGEPPLMRFCDGGLRNTIPGCHPVSDQLEARHVLCVGVVTNIVPLIPSSFHSICDSLMHF
jgi:hypothetical protein